MLRMFHCICDHIKYSFNNGNIRSAITIFKERNKVFDQETYLEFRYNLCKLILITKEFLRLNHFNFKSLEWSIFFICWL